MRLNGWQRLGIIASVIWAFVGGFWDNYIGIHAGDWVVQRLSFCFEHSADWKSCNADFDRDFGPAIADHWYVAAFVGLVPIPVAWLLVYALLGLWRWVRRGFSIQ